MTDTRPPAQPCRARIWPTWANHWVRCGSPVMPHNGLCAKYGHDSAALTPEVTR